MPIILSFVFSYHCVWSLLQHLTEHRGRVLDWAVDSSLQAVVLRRWTGRRELGRVISEFKLLLQTVESPALKRLEKLSQPCCGIFFQASGCKMSSYVPVFSEGLWAQQDLWAECYCTVTFVLLGGFCLWECCLPADLSLHGQDAFQYSLLSELMCKSMKIGRK